MEEDEIFEISDFTVATEWEDLTVKLESVIHEWDLNDDRHRGGGIGGCGPLPKDAFTRLKLESREERVNYSSLNFRVIHFWFAVPPSPDPAAAAAAAGGRKLLEAAQSSADKRLGHIPSLIKDLLDGSNDFAIASHPVPSWFGLREFLVLIPTNTADYLFNESKKNMVLSSMIMATQSTNCSIPFFLVIREPKEYLFSGVCQNRNIRTEFSTVRLSRAYPQYSHLSGLIQIFREKLDSPVAGNAVPLKTSVKFTYRLQEGLSSQFSSALPEINPQSSGPRTLNPFLLPFGVYKDPIKTIDLCTLWPTMNEDMLVENDIYSDIHPTAAPFWSLRVTLQGDEIFRKYIDLCKVSRTVKRILGTEEDRELDDALGALTQTRAQKAIPAHLQSLPADASASIMTGQRQLPLSETDINAWIKTIFKRTDEKDVDELREKMERTEGSSSPGAAVLLQRRSSSQQHQQQQPPEDSKKEGAGLGGKPEEQAKSSRGKEISRDLMDEVMNGVWSSKIAPETSLTWRISLALCILNNSMQGKEGVCHLWTEFVRTLEYFYDSAEFIPGLPREDPPDLNTCLLHQKLMLLQSCIRAKRRLKGLAEDSKDPEKIKSSDGEEGDGTEADEFFDADEFISDDNDVSEDDERDMTTGKESPKKPMGRKEPLKEGVFLLNVPGTLLYIPHTVDPSPMTEDMLDAEADRLMELGATPEAANSRAKMQSQSLLSDMQAFKAANPGCVMADFVRWHSPRDWISSGAGGDPNTGHLSERMTVPDNVWTDCWTEARAVPVVKQKRLFDDGKTARALISWMKNLRVSELALLTLPAVSGGVLLHLLEEAKDVYPMTGNQFRSLTRKLRAATASAENCRNPDSYRDMLGDVAWIEISESQYRAIRARLDGLESPETPAFVHLLMVSSFVRIIGGANSPFGQAITRLFQTDSRLTREDLTERKWPPPLNKEYVLRTCIPRPSSFSRPSPQRMYAFVGQDPREFRLALAFSEDITFF